MIFLRADIRSSEYDFKEAVSVVGVRLGRHVGLPVDDLEAAGVEPFHNLGKGPDVLQNLVKLQRQLVNVPQCVGPATKYRVRDEKEMEC